MEFVASIRSRAGVLCALLTLMCGARFTTAAPPANDTCAGAITIPSTAFPYLTPVLTNVHLATLTNDPAPSCALEVRRGVWYQFTPNQTAHYTFSTGNDTATTAFDTILGIFAAPTCGTVSTNNELACNDDSGAANNRAGLEVDLNAGVHYYVLVWLSQADDDPASGSLSLQLRVDRPLVPANDICANAEVIPNNLGFPRRSATNETIRAASEVAQPTCADGYRSVWYKFTPATTGTYILSTGPETATTVFDTMMVLYSTASDCNSKVEITCSDAGDARGSIFRTLTAGTTYYIGVYDQSPDPIVSETIVQLSIATPTVPSVITMPVLSVSSTGAVLNGSVNPNGLQSRFWFEWGPTTAYNSTSQTRLLFASTATTISNLVVTGFQPGTLYHYRMVATNNLGRTDGADLTFLWSTNRPSLAPGAYTVGGSYRFSFNANPRQLYAVETTTNLVNWLYLGLAAESPVGSGVYQYNHTGAGSMRHRFYRLNGP